MVELQHHDLEQNPGAAAKLGIWEMERPGHQNQSITVRRDVGSGGWLFDWKEVDLKSMLPIYLGSVAEIMLSFLPGDVNCCSQGLSRL